MRIPHNRFSLALAWLSLGIMSAVETLLFGKNSAKAATDFILHYHTLLQRRELIRREKSACSETWIFCSRINHPNKRGGEPGMSIERIQVENILGLLALANAELAQVEQDTLARADIEKPRMLTIEISQKPKMERVGERRRVFADVGYQVKRALPGMRGTQSRAWADDQSQILLINTEDPMTHDDPEQMTIYDVCGPDTTGK